MVVVVGVPSAGLAAGTSGWGAGRRRRLHGAVEGRVGRDVVEDVADERRGGLGPVAALVDDGQHEVGGVRVRAERHEPAVGLQPLLVRGRARLAGEVPRGREALEVRVGGAGTARDDALEPGEHGAVVGRRDRHLPGHLRLELLDDLAGRGSTISDATWGAYRCRAGGGRVVGEGRVGDRLLDGREHRLALPEGHLDVVAGEPRGRVGEGLGRLAWSLARVRWLSTRPCASPGRSMPVIVPSPYGGGLVLDRRLAEPATAAPRTSRPGCRRRSRSTR